MVLPTGMLAASMAAITSFVDVLPALPVTPITSPPHCFNAQRAVVCKATSVSGHHQYWPGLRFIRDRGHRALAKHFVHIRVAIVIRAAQRKEQISGRDGARVDAPTRVTRAWLDRK